MDNRPDWFSIIVLAFPMILSLVSWFFLWKRADRRGWKTYATCGAVSLSAAWLLSAIGLPEVLGPSYSGTRFAILYGNALAMFAAGIIACVQARKGLLPAGLGAFILTVLWLLAVVASSLV